MKKVWLGCLGALGLMALTGGWLIWFLLIREGPVLSATLDVPQQVKQGDIVRMKVLTFNPNKRSITLDSIDIDDSFMAGFQVVRVEPTPKDTLRLGILRQRSWEFGAMVPPGTGLDVTFELQAVAEGRWIGQVDVCNPTQDFNSLLADVMVSESAPVAAPARESK